MFQYRNGLIWTFGRKDIINYIKDVKYRALFQYRNGLIWTCISNARQKDMNYQMMVSIPQRSYLNLPENIQRLFSQVPPFQYRNGLIWTRRIWSYISVCKPVSIPQRSYLNEADLDQQYIIKKVSIPQRSYLNATRWNC